MDTKIGEVTHWFGDISVSVLELSDDLAVGDTITFANSEGELFSQEVESMEIDEEQVEEAAAGDVVAIKTAERVREGTEVYT